MTINKDIEAKILRYHFVEKWRIGTIATQLGIHHGVVDRVLSQAGLPKIERTQRTSMLTPYLPATVGFCRIEARYNLAKKYNMTSLPNQARMGSL
jgi:hypothetical protein